MMSHLIISIFEKTKAQRPGSCFIFNKFYKVKIFWKVIKQKVFNQLTHCWNSTFKVSWVNAAIIVTKYFNLYYKQQYFVRIIYCSYCIWKVSPFMLNWEITFKIQHLKIRLHHGLVIDLTSVKPSPFSSWWSPLLCWQCVLGHCFAAWWNSSEVEWTNFSVN